MSDNYFNRPSKAQVEQAIEHAGTRMDETDKELEFLQAEMTKIMDSPKPSKKEREKLQALQETMIAKGNFYMSLMGRMEALAWSIGSILKDPGSGAQLTIGEPFLKKKGPMLYLPDKDIQA